MKAVRLGAFAALAIGLAGGALLAVMFRQDIAAASERLAGRGETVGTALGRVEYAALGQGPPVLVVHGSGGGFDQGIELAGPLADRGFRILAPSRFGYLGSGMPSDPSAERQADVLAALLDRLGIAALPVMGASAGALSAIQFAIRHPGRCTALVLLVPASHSPERPPGVNALESPLGRAIFRAVLSSDFLFWIGVRFAPDFMVRAVLATDPALVANAAPAERRRVAEVLRHVLPISDRAEGLWFDTAAAGAPPPYAPDRIGCPVLALSAEDDFYGTARSARFAADSATDGRAVVYPTGGHLLVGRQRAAWGEIAEFLREAEEAAGRP